MWALVGKQFCLRGHDTWMVGRYADGTCRECVRTRGTRGTPKQFCIHGHDTSVVGRYTSGRCRECHRESTRTYRATHKDERHAYDATYRVLHAAEISDRGNVYNRTSRVFRKSMLRTARLRVERVAARAARLGIVLPEYEVAS